MTIFIDSFLFCAQLKKKYFKNRTCFQYLKLPRFSDLSPDIEVLYCCYFNFKCTCNIQLEKKSDSE